MKQLQSSVELLQHICSATSASLDKSVAVAHALLAVWLIVAACAFAAPNDPAGGSAAETQAPSKADTENDEERQAETEEADNPPGEGASKEDAQAKEQAELTAPGQLQSQQQAEAEHDNPILSGDLTLDYRGRWTGKQEDHDLAEYLTFRADRLYGDRLSVAGLLRATQRLDGRQGKTGLFRDILDTYDDGFQPRFYYLYADVNDVLGDESVFRLGRQYIDEHGSILIDGGKWAQSFSNGDYYLFVGRRATYYSGADGDLATGGGLSVSPWVDTKAAVDYARVEDDDFGDDMLSFRVWQRLPEDHLDAYARLRLLDNDPRDVLVTLTWDYPKYDVTAQASYFRVLTTQKQFGNEYTPFYQILGQLSRYQDAEITVTKGIGDHFSIFGGFNNRDVLEHEDVGTYNRDYNRFFIGFNVTDFLLEGLDFDVTAEHWNADSSGDRTTAISAELRKRLTDKLKVALGTSFSKFTFGRLDDFTLEPVPVTDEVLRYSYDRVNVRTYYGVLNYNVTESSYIRFRLEAESTSDVSPDIYTVGLTFGWSF